MTHPIGAPDAPSDLPNCDSPSLVVVQSTRDEMLRQWEANGASWRGPLSIDAYVRREDTLSELSLTKDGGLVCWILADTTIEPRRILAGCESIRKRALVAHKGTVEEARAYGIASVFCPEQYRHRGYASRLMREIGEMLRTWRPDEKPCVFSVLYSDVGKDFYAKFGWETWDSMQIRIPGDPKSQGPASTNLPSSRPLHASDLAELCDIDEGLVRRRLSKEQQAGKPVVALAPDLATMQWHHVREEFVAKEVFGKESVIKGAVTGEQPNRVWCYWTKGWYNPDAQQSKDTTLHILRVVIENEELGTGDEPDFQQRLQRGDRDASTVVDQIASILRAAQNEAQQWNIADVEVWAPSAAIVAAAKVLHPDAAVEQRDSGSIPCLRWYGELSSSSKGSLLENITWVGNEKYAWC